MVQVLDHGPKRASDRLMLLALADSAGGHGLDGDAEMSLDGLARWCGVDVPTVQRIAHRLERAGYIYIRIDGPQVLNYRIHGVAE